MSYQFNPFTGNLDLIGTGGGGTPGGSDAQVQFNSAGALSGDSGLLYDATTGALTVGGKTVSADAPVLNLSQTWNNAGVTFTGLKLNVTNTASASNSNLLDLQVGGVSRAFITSNGHINAYDRYQLYDGTTYRATSRLVSGYHQIYGFSSGLRITDWVGNTVVTLNRTTNFVFSPADGSIEQYNGTNAQTYRLYNTYTDASNYERGFLRWSSSVFEIGSEGAGTGSEKPVRITAATLKLPNLPTYADNAAATSGGLVAGDVYKTATGELRITV